MSLQKHPRAKLSGWRGPKYPRIMREVARAYSDPRNLSVPFLRDRCLTIPGFVVDSRAEGLTTKDGYAWFCGLEFQVIGGMMLVLLPWKRDGDRRDGSDLDRQPALYLRRFVAVAESQHVLKKLVLSVLKP